MRRTILLSLVLCLAETASPAGAMIGTPAAPTHPSGPAITQIEYFCSPGFVPSYGRCIAVNTSNEVELYLNDAGGYDEAPPPARVVRHRHRRHAIAERY